MCTTAAAPPWYTHDTQEAHMPDDHDPTGHVVLDSTVNWVCNLCKVSVEVAEWVKDPDGTTRWRWHHTKRIT
jgi:hypothetical protein